MGTISQASNRVIAFLDEVVLQDYDKLESLADNYKKDAEYYANVSGTLSGNAEELRTSIADINEILGDINISQKELDVAVQSINNNLQELTFSSETISGETEDMTKSILELQTTIQQFQM